MGIQVKCQNGHVFKVKDKYAGKKGLCPHCRPDQVVVQVPDMLSSTDVKKAYYQAIKDDHPGPSVASTSSDSSVLDDPVESSSGTSGSLLSESLIRHNVRCKCGESVPMWFARCPKCGQFMEHR